MYYGLTPYGRCFALAAAIFHGMIPRSARCSQLGGARVAWGRQRFLQLAGRIGDDPRYTYHEDGGGQRKAASVWVSP